MSKETLLVGSNYVVDIYTNPNPTRLESGYQTNPKFYHFRIPLLENTSIYGTPNLSSNPKFIRLYLTGFSSPVNLRFINLMFSEEIIDYSPFQKHY
jgi:cell surface protein SprA